MFPALKPEIRKTVITINCSKKDTEKQYDKLYKS